MVSLWGIFFWFSQTFSSLKPPVRLLREQWQFLMFSAQQFWHKLPRFALLVEPNCKKFPHCASFVFQFLAYLWRSAVGLRPRLTVPCSVYCPCLVLCLVESQNIYWVQLVFGISDFAFRNWGLRGRPNPKREMRRVPRKLCASHWQMVRAEDFVASCWSR